MPHTYMPTLPGMRGVKTSFCLVRLLWNFSIGTSSVGLFEPPHRNGWMELRPPRESRARALGREQFQQRRQFRPVHLAGERGAQRLEQGLALGAGVAFELFHDRVGLRRDRG